MARSELRPPVVCDTTVISNLARTDDLALLDIFDERIVTVPTVIDELRVGIDDHGYDFLTRALDTLEVVEGESEPDDSLDSLDPGETHALQLARERDGSLATDDLAARSVADALDIPVTGSLGVLARAVQEGPLDRDDADERFQQWINDGYRSPIESITEVLPDDN
jgi:predicted nucleic acid-binding protein